LSRGNRVRLVAGVWLVLQVAALAAAPISSSSNPAAPPAAHHDANCCPGIAPGQVCPMHHTREGGRTCTMSGGCRTGDIALLSLTFALGVPTPSVHALHLTLTSDCVPSLVPARIVRAELPESPPPRA
jgi:hypothetical protein